MCCKNDIRCIPISNQSKSIEAFQSVHDDIVILCYTMLFNFLSLIFALIRVRKLVWKDNTRERLRESPPVTNLVFSMVCEEFDNKI